MRVETEVAGQEAPIAAEQLPSMAYRGFVLLMLLLVLATSMMDRQILYILVEPIRKEFALNDTQLGLLTGIAFAITYVLVSVPVARLSDRSSRKNIIAIAVTFWSLMTALSGFAQNFVQLFLARIGVGVGEAGASAPSQALISDMFPLRQRGTAMSIYLLGAPIGTGVGLAFGGWALDQYGWRWALILVGLPGLVLGPLVFLTIRNVGKGLADGIRRTIPQPDIGVTLRTLARIRTLPFLMAGAGIQTLLATGLSGWIPAFLQRSHGMDSTRIGGMLGVALGTGSILGHLMGGPVSDYLGRRDIRWHLWLAAIVVGVSCIFSLVAFTGPVEIFFVAIGLQILVSGLFAAPFLTILTSLPPVWARATTAACAFFVINLIGMGIGPSWVGWMSDMLRPHYGEESLRVAMLLALLMAIPAALMFYLASRYYKDDYEAAGTRLKEEVAPAAGGEG